MAIDFGLVVAGAVTVSAPFVLGIGYLLNNLAVEVVGGFAMVVGLQVIHMNQGQIGLVENRKED